MYDGSDTIVLFEKLAYQDLLPVRWVPHPKAVDDVTAQNMSERNVRVRFTLLGEVVADHIEKLVFRRHRRKIADARRPRRA